jgi:multidrug efflux pump subunit AcrA (membrane-fusion protein)
MKSKKFIPLIILIGVLLAACGNAGTPAASATIIPTVVADNAIIAEGRLEPSRYTKLALNANGLVSEVLVAEGDQVSAGDLIARLQASEARTLEDAQASALQDLTSAYQEVRDAQFTLDNFDIPFEFNGMTPSEAVTMTLGKLNKAREDFEPYKYLSDARLKLTEAGKGEKDNVVYRDTARLYKKRLDDAWAKYRKAVQWLEMESNLESAQARLAQAQRDNDSLNDPSFGEDTAGARAALANAEVRAPFAGVVTDLELKVGEFAASGQPVVTVADISNWVVKTTDLTEIDVVNITQGQPVTIVLDAMPGVEMKGNVLSISQNYSENQGDIVYEVTVLLIDREPGMRWGMTAEVKFEY